MKPWVAKGIVEFFLMRSADASKQLLDNHFDYIYLDASVHLLSMQQALSLRSR